MGYFEPNRDETPSCSLSTVMGEAMSLACSTTSEFPSDFFYRLYRSLYLKVYPGRDEKTCRLSYWHRRKIISEHFKVDLEPSLKFRLYTEDILSREIFVNDFERSERDFVWNFLKPGDVFFDVGANVGLFTVFAAKKVVPTGKVYAFEPVAAVREKLLFNVHLNHLERSISASSFALSDDHRSLSMQVCEDGLSAFSSLGQPIVSGASGYRVERVQCMTLDHFFEDQKINRLDLMKIDVEGWESRVLKGAEKVLSLFSPVILIEFSDACAAGSKSTTAVVRKILENSGYQLFRFDMGARSLEPEPLRTSYTYANLIASKDPQKVLDRIRG